jgi:hypothetical protein
MLAEAASGYEARLKEKKEELSDLEKELNTLQAIVNASVEENKRAAASAA